MSANGLAGIPITNVENACAGGSTALNAAWMAIKAGQFDCVLAIGAEKLYGRDRAKTMEGFISGTDVEVTMQLIAQFQEGEKKRREEQAKHTGEKVVEEKPGGHSSFMDLYACLLYTSPSPRDRTRSRMPSSA